MRNKYIVVEKAEDPRFLRVIFTTDQFSVAYAKWLEGNGNRTIYKEVEGDVIEKRNG